MTYRFLEGVVNDFSRVSENTVDARSYFVPFSTGAACDGGDYVRARYVSDRVRMLNGEWDFLYFADGVKTSTFDAETANFGKINVPSSWENADYEPKAYLRGYAFSAGKLKIPDGKGKNNSFGVYRKSFAVHDFSKRYFLNFIRVGGFFEVHINGEYCGCSSNGRAEFDVTAFLKDGDNELVVAVKKWNVASLIDGGERYASMGITGDVYLVLRGANSLTDFAFVCGEEDDMYKAAVALAFDTDGNAELALNMELDGVECFSLREPISDSVLQYEIKDDFQPFLAEKPVLYDLYVRVIENDTVTECSRFKLSFGALSEMNGAYTYGGVPLKIRGVNYNADFNAVGAPMTIDDYAKDFDLIKAHGFNTVSFCREVDPAVVNLAAVKGLYVIDRIGVDTSGLRYLGKKKRDLVAEDTKFSHFIMERTASLYERDKSAAGLLAFSFGEEKYSAKNIAEAVGFLKERTDKLIFARTEAGDGSLISVVFHPDVDEFIDEINKVSAVKPVYMSEYALSGGVGNAAVTEFEEIIENTACCLGGSVSYFVDECGDGVGFKDEGLFSTDRKPYAGAKEYAFIVRPLRFKLTGDDKIEIYNQSYVCDTSDKDIVLAVEKNANTIARVKLDVNVPPRGNRELDVFLGHVDGEMYLTAECRRKSDGALICSEQLPVHTELRTVAPAHGATVTVRDRFDCIEVRFDSGNIRFSKTTGTVIGYNLMGKEILFPSPSRKGGACCNTKIVRPFVRNILNGKFSAPEYVPSDITWTGDNSYRADIQVETAVKIKGRTCFIVQDKYVVYSNGVVEVFSVLNPYKHCPPTLDCFAKQLRFHSSFEDVTYYGRGEVDNYIDMREHSRMGLYKTTATEIGSSCAFGQECGNRTDVHYAIVRDGVGDGLMLSAVQEPLQLRFTANSDEELIESYRSKKAPQKSAVYVDVAAFVSGYGSGNTGAPTAKHTVKSGEHILHFKMLPIYGDRDTDLSL